MKMKETDWPDVSVNFDDVNFTIILKEDDVIVFEKKYSWDSLNKVCYKSYDYGAPDFCYLFFENDSDEIILPVESKEDCEEFWETLKSRGLFDPSKEKYAQYSSRPEFNCHQIK